MANTTFHFILDSIGIDYHNCLITAGVIHPDKGGRDSERVWDGHVHTAIFKTDNQQGPTI